MTINRSVLIMGTLALIATAVALRKGNGLALQGLQSAGSLFLQILPNLIFGFILAGMIGVLVPRELIAAWLGEKSGWLGLMTGTFLGAVTPGGPFSQFPLVAAMWKSGASPGPLAAYLTSWALLGVNRVIIYEYPFMGSQFTIIHLSACLFAPPLIGLAVAQTFKMLAH